MHYIRLRKAAKISAGDVCSVDGCGQAVVSQGMCVTHHKQALAAGALDLVRVPARTVAERLHQYAVPGADPDSCWAWAGTTRRGYAQLNVGGKMQDAHRISYELHHGPLLPDHDIAHQCPLDEDGKRRGTRACTNPAHLVQLPHAEHAWDEDTGKLVPGQVHVIRKLIASERFTQSQIGAVYGVVDTTVSRIKRGTSWSELPVEEPAPELYEAALAALCE
jgi:hypothetical protein